MATLDDMILLHNLADCGALYKVLHDDGNYQEMIDSVAAAMGRIERSVLFCEKLEAREKWAAEKYGADTIEYRAIMGVGL